MTGVLGKMGIDFDAKIVVLVGEGISPTTFNIKITSGINLKHILINVGRMELLDRTDIRVVFNISVFRTANVDDNYEKQKQVDYPNFLKIRISVSKDEPDTGIVGKEN